MRILITGATGFIGRHLAARLASEHEIFALVRRIPDQPAPGTRYIVQDLAEPLDRTQLPHRLDAVIHQAALIDTERPRDDALPFLVNVAATWRLLAYARDAGVRSFVHASTGGVYGCGDRPFVEDDPYQPMDLYSLTKSQAELAVIHAGAPFPRVILRYFFPYGPGTPNPIPTYIRAALAGAAIPVAADRRPRFNPIHIDDAVTATVAALGLTQSMVLNIAGAETTTFAALAEQAAALAGRRPAFNPIPVDQLIPYYRRDLVADIGRMRSVLGITPSVPLATGIAQMVEYAMRNQASSAQEV